MWPPQLSDIHQGGPPWCLAISGGDNGHIGATVAEIVRLCRMIAQTPTINFRRGATLFPWQRMTQFFGTPSKIIVYPLGYVHAKLYAFCRFCPNIMKIGCYLPRYIVNRWSNPTFPLEKSQWRLDKSVLLLQFSSSLCKAPYQSNVKGYIDLGQ